MRKEKEKQAKLNWQVLAMLLLKDGEEEKYPSLATERALMARLRGRTI